MVPADVEQQHDHRDAESRADQTVEDEVDGAGDVEHPDHHEWMKEAPEIFESLQVPQSRPAGCRQADLLRQVRDLPVVPNVVICA